MELIDVNELLNKIEENVTRFSTYNDCLVAYKMAEYMNRVDAEPVIHAHWIPLDNYVSKCSKCGWLMKSKTPDDTLGCNVHNLVFRYCPSCGARIDEVIENGSN